MIQDEAMAANKTVKLQKYFVARMSRIKKIILLQDEDVSVTFSPSVQG